ncbi:MAG: hypothetical protein DGJ47_000441 [Rickettsiaceae bacterium]
MTKLEDFDFELPPELIAQEPSEKRDHSKLLVPRAIQSNEITDFYNIVDHLEKGDLMVFNNSRVINAKLSLIKNSTKEILVNLNRPIGSNKWLGFARPAKKLSTGDEFDFGEHQVVIASKLENGEIEIEFRLKGISIFEFLDQYGQLPLPQYIKRKEEDSSDNRRYQNVYSDPRGSVAAPTAGLHFTEDLLKVLQEKGVETEFVTLHVGAGTFLPVKTNNIEDHKMHTEWCEISEKTAEAINRAKAEGRRVILVGTTSMRTIESCAKDGKVIAGSRETNIFITPGYKFQIADMLVTNFHLPKSTLFMLVCAFSGQNEMKSLYQYAIDNQMRFFSYGDSMLLTRK